MSEPLTDAELDQALKQHDPEGNCMFCLSDLDREEHEPDCELVRLVAEVRRLRALFPDPEADAVMCEAQADEESSGIATDDPAYATVRKDWLDLARRIRATREEP